MGGRLSVIPNLNPKHKPWGGGVGLNCDACPRLTALSVIVTGRHLSNETRRGDCAKPAVTSGMAHAQMHGDITYNGSGLHEFVPQRTASYVSQVDDHIGEMTVRETFDFSVRPTAGCAHAVLLIVDLVVCGSHA